MSKKGPVYLIGAGPGDSGLITVRGVEVLKTADVIIYDYLVNANLLEYAKDNAEIIYVGKKSGQKEMSQKSINTLLTNKSKKGHIVARLKGGDPFVFGRGGEEAEALRAKNIPFEIVPGVSSVSAVPAYAGISLTHRDFTSSFAVVTGHEDPSKEKSNIPWSALSDIGTVVFLMGIKNLNKNMRELIRAGKNPDTPVAVITWGTYPVQKTLRSTISNISELVKKSKDISSPAVIVVGDVVKLREILNWYESKPLFGKTAIVTRPKEQSHGFVSTLENMGVNVISFPTIEIAPPRSYRGLDKAIKDIEQYDWIIFTSANGVTSFFNRLKALGADIRELHNAKIAAIGEVTAREIENMGIKVDIVPKEYKAEGLIKILKNKRIKGSNVLIPRARVARDILPESLSGMGAKVDVVTAYITKKPAKSKIKQVSKLLNEGIIDILTFTSSSSARNFFELIPGIKQTRNRPLIACIGPITANTVKEYGYRSHIVPKKYTVLELARKIAEYYTKKNIK